MTPTRLPALWAHRATALILLTVALAATACTSSGPARQAGENASTTPAMPALERHAVAPGLFELAHSQGKIYITSAGEDRRDGQPGQLLVLDADTLHIERAVPVDRKPFALAINHQTQTLYVGHSMDRSVSVYDLRTLQRKAVVALVGADASGKPYRSRQLLVDEATDTVYVSSPSAEGPVWVIDGATASLRGSIAGAGGPGIALDAQRHRLYTSGRGFWSVIDLQHNRVASRHALADTPDAFLVNLDVDPSTNRVFATESTHGDLVVLDPATGKVVQRVAAGAGAMAVKVNPARHEIYVSNRRAGTVTVHDLATVAVTQTLALPPYPNSFAFGDTPDTVFISVKQSRDPDSAGHRADKKESVAAVRFR